MKPPTLSGYRLATLYSLKRDFFYIYRTLTGRQPKRVPCGINILKRVVFFSNLNGRQNTLLSERDSN